MSTAILDTSIEFLKGVGPKRAEALNKELGIFMFKDLLGFFPFRYIDRSKFHSVIDIQSDSVYIQLKGRISGTRQIGQGRGARLVADFTDETGCIELIWFQGIKWFKDKFDSTKTYIVFGKPALFNRKFNIPHPEVELFVSLEDDQSLPALQPMYSSTEKLKQLGLDSRGIGKLTKTLIPIVEECINENLSHKILDHMRFISKKEAMVQIHHPVSQLMLDKAIGRLKFEELFFVQLKLLLSKQVRIEKSDGLRFEKVGELLNNFYTHNLPFTLTQAQKNVIREIRQDVGSGKQMNRLLQGDVGSGKTLVALMIILIALDNGHQAALMAPTEILAQQHFNSFKRFLTGMPVTIELLTGSVKGKQKTRIYTDTESGDVHILIGTHALIEDKVQFKDLGLVIVDEQHRFGVEQRARLWSKNTIPPHILVMTATPIPRTLAMTIYGDLDVSVINELPPGRKPVRTLHYFESSRLRMFGFMKEQIKQGRQIYIVYPMIYESEALDLKHLMEGYDMIANEFPLPHYRISIVHGKMKAAEKEFEMQRFKNGETQIMVSTTVIEVGVDVPNASVMIIESAQRFGLSQLHQLRGRVGRGADQSYCILMTDFKLSSDAKIRIDTMVRTNDGFEIAEADLRLRGPGDLQGTQQSGVLDLKLADIIRDEKLLQLSRDLAIAILKEDPGLLLPANAPMLNHMKQLEKKTKNWGMIS